MTDLGSIDLARVAGGGAITQFQISDSLIAQTAQGFAPKQVRFVRTVGRVLFNVAMAGGAVATWELLPHKR